VAGPALAFSKAERGKRDSMPLFGRRKKKPKGPPQPEETIRTAGVGDVAVISGFSPTYEDAYFLIERVGRYEGPSGSWHELIGVDGDRRVAIEWSEDDGLFITVTEQGSAMGIESVGLSHDELVRMDEENSLSSSFSYEGDRYMYRNSYEAFAAAQGGGEGEGFYIWEFASEDGEKLVSVVKSEGVPFEVYTPVVVAPEIVSVYKK
jgi:hypothetical protein